MNERNHDHTPPIPSDEGASTDICKLGMAQNHIHEHTGWTKWRPVIAFSLLTLGLILAVVRVEQVAHQQSSLIRQQTAAYVVQLESNCRIRDQQLRQAATNNAVGRRFFLDMAKVLRAEGNPRTAKHIEDGLKAIPPVKAPPKADCDLDANKVVSP